MQRIAWDGYLFSQPDSAFYFAQKVYDFAEAVDNKKWVADALNMQGISFAIRADYEKALEYYSNSLAIRNGLGDKKEVAGSFHNIGRVYEKQGNYQRALEYYLKSL